MTTKPPDGPVWVHRQGRNNTHGISNTCSKASTIGEFLLGRPTTGLEFARRVPGRLRPWTDLEQRGGQEDRAQHHQDQAVAALESAGIDAHGHPGTNPRQRY